MKATYIFQFREKLQIVVEIVPTDDLIFHGFKLFHLLLVLHSMFHIVLVLELDCTCLRLLHLFNLLIGKLIVLLLELLVGNFSIIPSFDQKFLLLLNTIKTIVNLIHLIELKLLSLFLMSLICSIGSHLHLLL